MAKVITNVYVYDYDEYYSLSMCAQKRMFWRKASVLVSNVVVSFVVNEIVHTCA